MAVSATSLLMRPSVRALRARLTNHMQGTQNLLCEEGRSSRCLSSSEVIKPGRNKHVVKKKQPWNIMFIVSLSYKMDTVWICYRFLKAVVHDFFKTFRCRLNLVRSPQPTCLNQVLHGRKPLVDGCAHRAVDKHTRKVDIAHQSSSGQPGSLVRSTNVTCYQCCQTVRPGYVLKLAPPTRHDQGHIKTWVKTNVEQFEWWFSTTQKLSLWGFTL